MVKAVRRHRWIWAVALIGVIAAGSAVMWTVVRSGDDTSDEAGADAGDDAGGEAPNRPESVPVLAYLLSPTAASDLVAGDTTVLAVQAAAADGVATTEVVVDGRSLGAVENQTGIVEWEWLAWPPGIHTVQARASDANGETGQSPTLVVNVLAPSDDLVVVPAAGQGLDDVAATYGLEAEVVAAANPQLAPAEPLSTGDSIRVPVAGAVQIAPSGNSSAPEIATTWTLHTTEPADEAYCYVSSGTEWNRVPSDPFQFFTGDGGEQYADVRQGLVRSGSVLESECWAWVGGSLTFLGAGQTSNAYLGDPDGAIIAADAFNLVGQPQVPIPTVPFIDGPGPPSIPAPFALRATTDVAECTQHHGNLFAAFICDALINEPVKKYLVLVWEWSADQCWAEACVDDIDGYRVYQISPSGSPTLLAQITNPGQQTIAVPKLWAGICYGIDAYSDDPTIQPSTITEFCPGDVPATESMSIDLSQWMTVGGLWVQDGDCDGYGSASFTGSGSRVLVGSAYVDDDDGDCFREMHFDALLAFKTPVLPPGAVVHDAILSFDLDGTTYGATGVASNDQPFCASAVRRADSSWTASVPPSHWKKSISMPPGPQVATIGYLPSVDITSTYVKWNNSPSTNHGLVVVGRWAPHPVGDGSGVCYTYFDDAVINVTFFVP